MSCTVTWGVSPPCPSLNLSAGLQYAYAALAVEPHYLGTLGANGE